jgi:hypothetical protein
MKTTTYLRITAIIFALVAIAHAAKIFLLIPVTIGAMAFPRWLSWFAVFAASFLAIWGYIASRKH